MLYMKKGIKRETIVKDQQEDEKVKWEVEMNNVYKECERK